jgi:hypothetical protein
MLSSLTIIEVPLLRFERNWPREKESNLHFRVQSPTCCQLHHPGLRTNFGALGFEPRTLRRSSANTAYKAAALPVELCPGGSLVAVEGVEPTSLDYQSSALPLSYTAMVDPTGLKPAPHGLKGRCSVARAPGQEDCRLPISNCRLRIRQLAIGNRKCFGCGGRTRTFDGRINSAGPYQLGYATKSGCGGESRTRIISFTRRALLKPIELRRNLVDWEGVKPSREVCRTSMLSVTSPAQNFGGCGWS